MARGKRFDAAYEKVDRTRHYPPAEAVGLVKETAGAKFDETVELHVKLGLNVRHAEEQLRGTLALPNGLGKSVSVAVFAEGDAARAAEEAGADHVGAKDLAEKIEGGFTDFDVAIATPSLMGPVVSKLGRVLGPQGKMPNPKVGTVTDDVAKAVSEAKAGKIEYRTDRQANVHVAIGKASFPERSLLENYAAVIDEIVRAKPAAAKGRYMESVTLATTMGPGIRVDSSRIRESEILADMASGSGETAEPKPEAEAKKPAVAAKKPAAKKPAAKEPTAEEPAAEEPAAEVEAPAEEPAAKEPTAEVEPPAEEPAAEEPAAEVEPPAEEEAASSEEAEAPVAEEPPAAEAG